MKILQIQRIQAINLKLTSGKKYCNPRVWGTSSRLRLSILIPEKQMPSCSFTLSSLNFNPAICFKINAVKWATARTAIFMINGSFTKQTLKRTYMSYNNSSQIGEDFEDYVEDRFPSGIYELLHRTPGFNPKRFNRSALNPDFQFEIKELKKSFWVECKYRGNQSDSSAIPVFKTGQLERYRSYRNSFLFLCTYRFDEELMFFVPMKDLKWDDLFLSFLEKYRIDNCSPVMPETVIKYLKQTSWWG